MKRHIQKVMPKSRIGRSVLVLMSGTAMAQAITAASMPIVTRLYTPEMIGVISVYLSFFNFWLVIVTWRYENALLIAEDEEESHHVFRLGAVLTFVTALVAVPALGFLQYKRVLGFDILPVWAPAIAFFSLLGIGWFALYRSWLLRLQDTRAVSFSAVARAGGNSGVRVATGLVYASVHGLFLAEIIGAWAALGSVRKKTKKRLKMVTPDWSLARIKGSAIRYKKFAQFEMPSSVINQLAVTLPVPIVGSLYGAEAAGWFGMARLLYAIPNGQIGKAAGDVFQIELGKCVRGKDYKRGERLFYQFSARLALVGLVPLVLAILLAPPLVPYIFGEEWRKMGVIVAHMAPWMFMALIVNSMSRALSVLQKQQWKLLYDFTALLVVLFVYGVSIKNSNGLIQYIDYLSVGLSGAYVLYFFIIAKSVRRNK